MSFVCDSLKMLNTDLTEQVKIVSCIKVCDWWVLHSTFSETVTGTDNLDSAFISKVFFFSNRREQVPITMWAKDYKRSES